MVDQSYSGPLDIQQVVHATRVPAADAESRARKIERIISRRQPHAEGFRHLRSSLSALKEALVSLKARVPGMDRDPLYEEIKKIPLDELLARTDELSNTLTPLEKRLNRKTLNVVVVGGARMGKSLLLRRLSGLGANVIPDREGDPCTGVRSVIEHHEGAETAGTVHYHTEESLLKIIGYYWDTLDLASHGLGERPSGVADFLRASLPAPEALFREARPQNKTLRESHLDELRKYQTHLPPLLPRLGKVEQIREDQIKQFVTQPQTAGGAPGPESHLYLVVREVVIRCDFRHEGVGQIALIDLPGLGEAKLGGPERMVETLEQDADVVLYVIRPMPTEFADKVNHFEVYDTCYSALGKYLPLERWAYMVINKQDTPEVNNLRDCDRFLAGIRTPAEKFFGWVICDCSDPEEVGRLVLEPVVDYMSEQIASLDAIFARAFAADVEALRRDVEAVVRRGSALRAEDGVVEDDRFMQCFGRTWEELKKALNGLVEEFDRRSEEVDDQFSRLVQEVVGEFEQGRHLPDESQAGARITADGYGTVYEAYLNDIRAALSTHLRRLDTGLDQKLLDVKNRVGEIFRTAGELSAVLDGGPPLALLAERVPAIYPELSEAVGKLDEFEMSARGIIGYKVRLALNRLESNRNPMPPLEEQTPARLVADLQERVREALSQITDSLAEDEFRSSNRCAYAVFADFRDAVLYSPRARDKWATFYRPLRGRVWPEFTRLEEARRRREEWLAWVEKAAEAARAMGTSLPPVPPAGVVPGNGATATGAYLTRDAGTRGV